jgi:hypothetical protein
MRKNRIKPLSNKYIIAYHIKINKGTKVFLQSKIIWVNIYQLLINVVLKLADQIRIAQMGGEKWCSQIECPYIWVSYG